MIFAVASIPLPGQVFIVGLAIFGIIACIWGSSQGHRCRCGEYTTNATGQCDSCVRRMS